MSTENPCSCTKQKQFDMAVRLASLAAELDDAKNDFEPYVRHLSIGGVGRLHTLAQELAGDRAGEIYAPDDEEVA